MLYCDYIPCIEIMNFFFYEYHLRYGICEDPVRYSMYGGLELNAIGSIAITFLL